MPGGWVEMAEQRHFLEDFFLSPAVTAPAPGQSYNKRDFPNMLHLMAFELLSSSEMSEDHHSIFCS